MDKPAYYVQGASRHRIFTANSTLNVYEGWVSGFSRSTIDVDSPNNTGSTGVAYHNPNKASDWVTQWPVDRHGDGWVLSTDWRGHYRSQGVDRTLPNARTIDGRSPNLCINCGWNGSEYSEWAVALVLVYNRLLSEKEILHMEAYLSTEYGIPLETSSPSKSLMIMHCIHYFVYVCT